MFKRAPILLIVVLLAGCATSGTTTTTGSSSEGGIMDRYAESRKLEEAVDLLEEGKTVGAARVLHTVATGKRVPGVTDEALFRLALLALRGGEKGQALSSQHLRRLKKEYPGSPWTLQAAPLASLLNEMEELKEQNRSLKGNSQALNREVGDLKKEINALNSQIRQLRNLDLELEQRGR